MSLHRDNHFVPRTYLKRWASPEGRVWTYRILVSHPHVPLWKESSTRGVAYHSHLYTRIIAGGESDEIETWLDREFEAPAEDALHKATSGARLKPSDWKRIIRFVAAQDVRTPARLSENLQRWSNSLPDLIQSTLQESVRKLESARASGEPLPEPRGLVDEIIPFRVTTVIEPDQEVGILKGEAIAGRGLWLFSIRHLLTSTEKVLHQHMWTILSPPEDLSWFSSDDPVIRLNYRGPGDYDFKGGWGSPGTEILLPLGPRHLLYTQIGKRPPLRGTTLSDEKAQLIRRLTAEHAHRMIFAKEADSAIPQLRPRTVDVDLVRSESEQWQKWHEEQTTAECELMGW